VDTSIRVIGEVMTADGSVRPVYELEDGTEYVVDDDGCVVTGIWLLMPEEEEPEPCDRPVIVYPDGAGLLRPTFVSERTLREWLSNALPCFGHKRAASHFVKPLTTLVCLPS
jgi:hypothetical protein